MQIVRYIVAIVLAALALQVSAQVHQARGQYSLSYKEVVGSWGRKEAPAQVKQRAQQEATLKAIEAYYAEAGQSASANFDSVRGAIMENMSRYVLDTTVISENDNVKDAQYSLVVRVSLNVANLRNAMQASSAVAKVPEGDKSAFSFVFVSRQVDSTKSFDDRVYKRQESSIAASGSRQDREGLSEKTTEGESIKRNQISTHGSATRETDRGVSVAVKSVATSETGGSTVTRASESTWRIVPSANLNQVFVAQFSQAGYDVVEAAMVESEKFKVADIEVDYKSGNDLQPKTMRAIAAGMKDAQIPYIALGTLDVGMPIKDSQTGLVRVAVTVNAKVWDVTRPIPRTRVAVGPVDYSGVGPTEAEARGNALKSAANSASQELSSRMATMGLR